MDTASTPAEPRPGIIEHDTDGELARAAELWFEGGEVDDIPMDAVEDAWWFACLIPVRPDLFDWPREDARSWLAAEIEMAEHDDLGCDGHEVPHVDTTEETLIVVYQEQFWVGEGWHRTAAALAHDVPYPKSIVGVPKAEVADHDQAEAHLRSILESLDPEARAPTDPSADRRRRMST